MSTKFNNGKGDILDDSKMPRLVDNHPKKAPRDKAEAKPKKKGTKK